MTAPTRLIGMVDDRQYGTLVTDVYEHIPDLLYPSSIEVYGQMRRDGQLAAILDGYSLQLRRAQWQLDGAGCRPEVTQFVADCLGLNVVGEDRPSGARRRGVSWNDHLRSALLSQVWGHYAFEMEAEVVDGRARLTVLAERMPATITEIHADPKTGALLGIDQSMLNARRRSPEITADRLVFYSRNREGSSWQGQSLIRPAYSSWLIKREMIRVNAISNRRWGAGVPVAKAQAGTSPTPGQMQEAQRLASAARAGDQAGAAMPPGFDLQITGLSGSVPDTLGFIQFLNGEMARSVLMQHIDLGTTATGSRALGASFIDSWTLALEAEAEAIADAATRQACTRIVDWNWGEDEPVPRVVVSGVGSRREVTAESLQLLLNSGALSADPGLEAWVRREYRLPEREEGPEPTPARPTTTPSPSPATEPAQSKVPSQAPRRPSARGRRTRSPGQLPLFAAADDPDPAQLQADWEQAKADLLEQWPAESEALIEELAVAAGTAAAAGALADLGSLSVGEATVAAVAVFLTAGMSGLAVSAAASAVAEVVAAGGSDTAPDDPGADQVEALSQAHAAQLAAGYASAAGRKALTLAGPDASAGEVEAAVRDHLAEMSTTEKGLAGDAFGAALMGAQNAGRLAVFANHPDATYVADESGDPASTRCGPCKDIDGTEFDGLDAMLAAYPVLGYVSCKGQSRCRGRARLKSL